MYVCIYMCVYVSVYICLEEIEKNINICVTCSKMFKMQHDLTGHVPHRDLFLHYKCWRHSLFSCSRTYWLLDKVCANPPWKMVLLFKNRQN